MITIPQLPAPFAEGSHAYSLRESMAYFESLARLTFCLANYPQSAALGMPPLKIPSKSGYGAYLGLLHQLAGRPGADPKFIEMVRIQCKASETGLGDKTVREWRNSLSHGAVEPSAAYAYSAQASRLLQEVHESVKYFFSRWEISGKEETGWCVVGVLNPLVAVSHSSGVLGFYDGFEVRGRDYDVDYQTLDAQIPEFSAVVTSESRDIHSALREVLPEDSKYADMVAEIRRFHSAVKKDIAPFAEKIPSPRFDIAENNALFTVSWKLRTSQGWENRRDVFSIEQGSNRRLWRPLTGADKIDNNYVEFIKDIASWQVLRERLKQMLESVRQDNIARGVSEFGFNGFDSYMSKVPRRFQDIDHSFELGRSERLSSAREMREALDQAVKKRTATPQVFFLTGEAGVGKTHTLVETAWERLAEVLEKEEEYPLYIYMDCSGIPLKTLADAINSYFNELMLGASGQLACLCRNGLAVLLIDGFDELLGGVGYKDALGVMEPFLDSLGSSGTVMISARSSYLANQYRASLEGAQLLRQSGPEHYLVRLLNWLPEEVEQGLTYDLGNGFPLESIPVSDMELLRSPFFYLVFVEWIKSADSDAKFTEGSLARILIDKYFEREIGKLRNSRVREISPAALGDIFEQAAELMFEDGVERISLSDFNLCAQSALEIEEFEGHDKDLDARLQVLCGLEVRRDDDLVMFGFEHPVYFNEFLLRSLLKKFEDSGWSTNVVRKELERSVLPEHVVRGLLTEEMSNQRNSQLLGRLGGVGGSIDGVLSSNLGLLLSVALVMPGGIQLNHEMLNINAMTLYIGEAAAGRLILVSSRAKKLRMSFRSGVELVLDGSDVEHLTLIGESAEFKLSDGSIAWINGFRVGVLVVEDEQGVVKHLLDSQIQILDYLMSCGFTGLEDIRERIVGLQVSPSVEFTKRVLNRMRVSQKAALVVEKKTYKPGRDAEKWMEQPVSDAWPNMVHALVESGAGKMRQINASGPAKMFVSFSIAPGILLDGNGNFEPDSRIDDFWERIG
ncbi:NACHT domain-containing NTPase [Kocuria sabuli]|uniref:NACHT domain-containing protein n=1 Tax=Kocuria sabuli TaxID=3071448 RepID=UPI0034D4DFCC